MKTIISRLCCFIGLTAMMVSCNLFIDDDELEANEFRNVPVHSGEGYDAPVKEHESGCDIEYQFNSDVRVVEAETQDAYITGIQFDDLNMVLIVNFRVDTPKELLPHVGEIFLSKSTSKFPMGANHRVLECERESDGYHCVMAFAKLEETFKTLHINGSVDFGTEYYSVPIPPSQEEVATARTRGVDDAPNLSADVICAGNKIDFKFPFRISYNESFPNGTHAEVTVDPEQNFYKVTNEFIFDDFSLDNMKADYVQTIEEKAGIVISGGFTKSFHPLKNLYIVRNKPIPLGHVVIVFWISVDLYVDLDISTSVTITKNKKYRNIYHLDLYESTMTKETKVLKNDEWELDWTIQGSVALRAELTIGFGIYGKVLTVRIIPTLTAALTATLPLHTHESDQNWFDLSNAAGLEFTLKFSVKLGVFLDLDLKSLLGNDDRMRNKEFIDRYKNNDPEIVELFNKLSDQTNDNNHSGELGVYDEFGPWNIITPKKFTWYPAVDDNSFKIIRAWDKGKQKMTFSAEYKLKKLGFLASMGKQFTPALMIKKGNKYVTTIFPTEGGMTAKCSMDKTYSFDIPTDNKDQDVMYVASPCYYPHPIISNYPEASDKGMPFCNTSPKIALTDIEPISLEVEWLAENGKGEKIGNDYYDWSYVFGVKTYTAIKGMANIDWWAVKEENTNTTNRFKSERDEKHDGIYGMYWDFTVYRQNDKKFTQFYTFYPQYYVKGKKESEDGKPMNIKIRSDRTYELECEDGSLFESDFSRMRGDHFDDDDDDSKSVVRAQLNAIEYDGEIIWQRPGSNFQKPEPSATPFQKL